MRLASYVPGELIPVPLSGSIPELPHVAKVENRTTLKISRKSIFGLLCRCVAFQRHSVRPPKKTFATISLPKRTSSVRPVRSEKCHKQKWAIFDHLTRADEQRRRHGEAERFGSFHINH